MLCSNIVPPRNSTQTRKKLEVGLCIIQSAQRVLLSFASSYDREVNKFEEAETL